MSVQSCPNLPHTLLVALIALSCEGPGPSAPPPNQLAAATITSPADGANFTVGATISFVGSGTDAEDGSLSSTLVWTSDLEGQIGTGMSFTRSNLSVGSHEILLIATDSGGAADTANVTITITAAGQSFYQKLDTLEWVGFAPTGFDPSVGRFPSEASIRVDLQLLAGHGFTGVITFASDGTLSQIPRIATEVGFQGVIMGLFMFNTTQRTQEIPNAISAAQYVDAYGIGNEGLIGCGGSAYDLATLTQTLQTIQQATGRPVTTSEQIEDYLHGGCLNGTLLSLGDWLFPILHPFNNGIRDPRTGASFAAGRLQTLAGLVNQPVFAKETGWPACGDAAATEVDQETYFQALKPMGVHWAYFEAFDEPFKASFPPPWEPCWGLFQQDGTPKLFISRNQP